jgi:hypothetical protein
MLSQDLLALSKNTDEQIYIAIGKSSNQLFSDLSSDFSYDEEFRSISNYTENSDLYVLGRSIFIRWCRSLFQLICSNDLNDEQLRSQIASALTGKEGGTAIIAGALTSLFGVSPIVAILIATLIIRIFLVPSGEEICKYLGKKLENEASL